MKRIPDPELVTVTIEPYYITLTLVDGRILSVPISWFPRLAVASLPALADWDISPDRTAVRWPALDEDISVRVLLGLPS